MKKLFDVVVWETEWAYSVASDTEIPSRAKAYWGNDGKLVASFNSIRTATRVCKELRESIKMSNPKPIDIGGGKTYIPREAGVTRSNQVSFGIVLNDRDIIL